MMTKREMALKLQDVHHYFGSILHFYGSMNETREFDSTFDCSTLMKALRAYDTARDYLTVVCDGMGREDVIMLPMAEELLSQEELLLEARKGLTICLMVATEIGAYSHTGLLKDR